MITLPAFFGDPQKQTAFVATIARIVSHEKQEGSLFAGLDNQNLDRAELYRETGFPVSLLEVIDQIYRRLENVDAFQFATRVFSVVKPGGDVAGIGWGTVEYALSRGVAFGGEAFVDAARKAPARFPCLAVPVFTLNQLQQAQKRSVRLALKLGYETPSALWDPRVIALLNAAMRGGEVNAGITLCWSLEQAVYPECLVRSYVRKLIELLEAA
jgi:hypothetical protein